MDEGFAQLGIKMDEGFSRTGEGLRDGFSQMASAIASLKAPSPPPRASAGASLQPSGSSSPLSSKGSTAKKKQLEEAAATAFGNLVAAFDGVPGEAIALDPSSLPLAASSVAMPLLSSLIVHRFSSDFRSDDFWLQDSAAAEALLRPHAPPGEEVKGASCFVVLSSDRNVVLAAHVYMRLMVKDASCYLRPLAAIPDVFSLHIDRVLAANAAGAPIIAHASLAPVSPMSMRDFSTAASVSWPAFCCSLKAGAEEEVGDLEHGSLHELSEDTRGYFERKLAAAVLSREQPVAPGGVSPAKA